MDEVLTITHSKRVNDLKKLLESAGFELDSCQSECQKLRTDVTCLTESNARLTRKLDVLQLENENIKPLQIRLDELEKENSEFKMELNRMRTAAVVSKSHYAQVNSDLDAAIRQAERSQKETESATEELGKLRMILNDEIERHNQTRELLDVSERQLYEDAEQWQSKYAQLMDQKLLEESHFKHRLEQERSSFYDRDQEYLKQISELKIKESVEAAIAKMEDQKSDLESHFKHRLEQERSSFRELEQSYIEQINELRSQSSFASETTGSVDVVNEEAQLRQATGRDWSSVKIILLFVIISGSIYAMSPANDPPLLYHGLLLVPWRWPLFSAI